MNTLADMLATAHRATATAPSKASPRRKRTKAIADQIRTQAAQGVTVAQLMRAHKASRDCICGILEGRYYATPDRPKDAPTKRSVTWRYVGLPDSDIEVMVALIDGDVRPAFHDGEQWRDLTAWPLAEGVVLAWCDYPDHPAPPVRSPR